MQVQRFSLRDLLVLGLPISRGTNYLSAVVKFAMLLGSAKEGPRTF